MQIEFTLTVVQRALFLMELPQFREMGSEEVASLAAKMVEMRFEPGESLHGGGSQGDKLFVLLDGEVEHERNGVIVRAATRGMAVGLFGLMGIDEPGDVVARTAVHAIALYRDDFIDAVSDHPAFALGMIRALAHTIQEFADRVERLERRLQRG
jgi:CRP-like cAMP-binding protein